MRKAKKPARGHPGVWLVLLLVFLLVFSYVVHLRRFIPRIFRNPDSEIVQKARAVDVYEGVPTDKYLTISMDMLAKSLKIENGDISLLSFETRDWENASLGCPREGETYAQAIVPGYIITLEYQGKIYRFHAGSGKAVTCEGG